MFTLDDVVPWGRSFDEYQRMFALTKTDLGLKIVGCGDGPANFNAAATRRGSTVISCDPIYRFLVEVSSRLLEQIAVLIEAGELTMRVGDVLPLSDARLAHEMLAGKPHKPGKIVLRADGP